MTLNKFVYVIWRRDGAHKIGYSMNPIGRAAALRSQVGQKTRLVYTIERPRDAMRVERIAHNLLKRFWLGGEWFRVNEAAAIQAVLDACLESGKIDDKIVELQRKYAKEQKIYAARDAGNAAIFEEFNRWATANPEEFAKLPLIQRYHDRRKQQ